MIPTGTVCEAAMTTAAGSFARALGAVDDVLDDDALEYLVTAASQIDISDENYEPELAELVELASGLAGLAKKPDTSVAKECARTFVAEVHTSRCAESCEATVLVDQTKTEKLVTEDGNVDADVLSAGSCPSSGGVGRRRRRQRQRRRNHDHDGGWRHGSDASDGDDCGNSGGADAGGCEVNATAPMVPPSPPSTDEHITMLMELCGGASEYSTRTVLKYLLVVRCCGNVQQASEYVVAKLLGSGIAPDEHEEELAQLVAAATEWHAQQERLSQSKSRCSEQDVRKAVVSRYAMQAPDRLANGASRKPVARWNEKPLKKSATVTRYRDGQAVKVRANEKFTTFDTTPEYDGGSREFPQDLGGVVSEREFSRAIDQINNTLNDYWPCHLCFCCGYTCCICTLGLSLFCPNLCISDAESYVRQCLDKINAQASFKTAGVRWDLHKSCGFPCATSWIEVSFRLPEEDHLLSLPDHEEEV